MISLETINQRIEKIEEYRDKLYNQRLKMPKINSYSIHEIIDLKYRQSKEYRIDENLFGKLPFEYRVYQLFQEYNQELETAGAREKTAATINQEDNINIGPKTVKKLVRRVNYRLTLHENFEKKQDLIGYEKEVEYAKKAIHYINWL